MAFVMVIQGISTIVDLSTPNNGTLVHSGLDMRLVDMPLKIRQAPECALVVGTGFPVAFG